MKHFAIFAFVVLVTASSFALASKPPARLEADTVTGGDGPATQGMTDANPQPVSIVNWLIDENGNIRVSNQVRDALHILLDTPIMLALGDSWQSEWVDASRFNLVRFDAYSPGRLVLCSYVTSWFEGHEYSMQLEVNRDNPGFRYEVFGPRIAVRCNGTQAEPRELRHVYVYLRAE